MDHPLTIDYIEAKRASLLAELKCRQAIARDYVRGVAKQYDTGLYLFGKPGTAKTHTVLDVLKRECCEPFHYQRGHLTPVGLFELIADHPDEIIVLDDLVTIFRSDIALQILLSALEHPAPGDRTRTRIVRYRRKGEEQQVAFQGGIICITNRELHDEELLGAFKSRVHTLNYDPPKAQLGALMLAIAEFGNHGVKPDEALAVARFVIGEMLRIQCNFDLRLFVNKALSDYQQWKDEETESHWRDLVTASIEEHLVAVRHAEEQASRATQMEEERAIVREIIQEYSTRAEQIKAWKERTGKSERAFYRRQEELH